MSQNYQTQDGISYVKEIQLMMHGFGDVSEPLVPSAQLIESILLQEMNCLWRNVCSVAQMEGSPKPTVENFMFLLRKNSVKAKRYLKYLKIKDLKDKLESENKVDLPTTKMTSTASKRLKRCVDYLQSLNPNFDPNEEEADDIYLQRKIRADLMARNMDDVSYLEYTKARQASFGHGKFFNSYNFKFREWLNKIDGQSLITNETCDTMAYFAYETVAEIVDLALLVKQDSQTKDFSEPEFPKSLLTVGRSTVCKQMEHRSPITPNEIREALRRFESTQSLPGFLFVRQTSSNRTKLLCL